MSARHWIVALASAAAVMGPVAATAADRDQTQDRAGAGQTVYGSQLMTRQERLEYRNHMRSLKTQQEREQFRLEHHARMQERARERGVTLPDMPQTPGAGMGPGKGMGPGGGGRR